MRLVTIGAYGFNEAGFLKALVEEGVDTFIDVRQRRGVRGSKYAFVNSKRLQRLLGDAGIAYVHLKHLAPTTEVRDVQRRADVHGGTGKRDRRFLSQAFVEAYRGACLSGFEPEEFIAGLGPSVEVAALFCVEGHPRACHRSILSDELSQALDLEVRHITP